MMRRRANKTTSFFSSSASVTGGGDKKAKQGSTREGRAGVDCRVACVLLPQGTDAKVWRVRRWSFAGCFEGEKVV